MLQFLIDAQLPPGLAELLSECGLPAEHVNRINLGDASDADIWAHASARKAVIITKDSDFVQLARQARTGPQVVWVRLGNVTNRKLRVRIAPILPELIAALKAGERVVEII